MRSTECDRVASLSPFDSNIKPLYPPHNCCLVCRNNCVCSGCGSSEKLPYETSPTGKDVSTYSLHIFRTVSNDDQEDLQKALTELFWGFLNKEDESEVKFYKELISDLVSNCQKIFTVEDIISNYAVFSLNRAINILEIFNDIFNDISTIPLLRELEVLDSLVEQLPFWSLTYTGHYTSSTESDSDIE